MAHRCGFEGCKAPGLIPLVEGRLYLCIIHVNKVLDSIQGFRTMVEALRRSPKPKQTAAKRVKRKKGRRVKPAEKT